jgi:hypothetical protein
MYIIGMYVPLWHLTVIFAYHQVTHRFAGVYDTDAPSDGSIDEGRLVIRVGDEYANVYIFIVQN